MIRVLYVEDDVEHRMLVSNMLTSRGFAVETAEDGLEGVEKVRRSRPDLILLDLLLPHMDGFGVMRSLRQDITTQDIPVIVISAWPTADNRRRVREAGARAFVAKPFQAKELLRLIQENLPQSSEEPGQPEG
jgi:CheY-like chemotaxis protein